MEIHISEDILRSLNIFLQSTMYDSEDLSFHCFFPAKRSHLPK